VVALAAAWWSVPRPPAGRSSAVDLPGAALLGVSLLALLLAIGQTAVWIHRPAGAVALVAAAVVLLGAWVRRERRCAAPLVDLTLLRNPAVAGADAVMLLGGIGMYLLLTLVTRYVQTPASAGYGFGAGVFVAGLVLVPFSAAMPAAILAVTPAQETSSAMSFNQVVRSVGFSIGSALGGLTLAARAPAGSAFPVESGYAAASWLGAATMGVTVVAALMLRADRPRRTPHPATAGPQSDGSSVTGRPAASGSGSATDRQ